MSESAFPATVDTWPSEAQIDSALVTDSLPFVGDHASFLRKLSSAHAAVQTELLPLLDVSTTVDAAPGTDITVELNAAIVASGWPNNPATVIVKPGEYTLSDGGGGVGVLIDGAGLNSTPALEIVLDGVYIETNAAIQMVRITNSVVSVTRIRLRGGTLAPNASGASGVVLNNAEFCTITTNFLGAGGKAIRLTGTSTNNTIIASEFSNLKCGVSIEGIASNLAVIGCAFAEELSGSPFGWIDVDSGGLQSFGVVVAMNRFRGIGAIGFPPTKPIVNVPYGIGWSITGNTFHDSETTSIFIGGNGSSYGHTITGNTFIECKSTDILIDGGKGCSVTGNRHGARAAGTTVSTYFCVDVRDPFAVNGGSDTVITGLTSADTGTALANSVSIAATCNNCVVIGSAAIAASVPSGTIYLNGAIKPSITGSRAGNAALASLLTQGAARGLWTDSTTA